MALKVYIYGLSEEESPPIIKQCSLLIQREYALADSPAEADLAIAPLLTDFLTLNQINAPQLGTLIFHPSLLPRHRGGDAIKWAFKLGETYSGVTWFWADEGVDTGDICEQEVLSIHEGERPGTYYARAVIPAALRTLERALKDCAAGHPRRVPQIAENGSYEPKLPRKN